MKIELGVKSDPIEYRYSYSWLFKLMERLEVRFLQLGSSFEMYSLPDRYFTRLRTAAEDHGISIHSCFTAHRELGGLLREDADLQRVAYDAYSRYIEIGALVGAASVGSNPGSILRDQMESKKDSEERYFSAMEELRRHARQVGLECLTLESMSATAEPPTSTEEITDYMTRLNDPASTTTPVYICGDMAHGYADESGAVIESNMDIFEHSIPWMWEFHIKNTDSLFKSTFGFSPEDSERGIVNLRTVADLMARNSGCLPRETVVGYLEFPGPKLGRDYSDIQLENQLVTSIRAIQERFLPALMPTS